MQVSNKEHRTRNTEVLVVWDNQFGGFEIKTNAKMQIRLEVEEYN